MALYTLKIKDKTFSVACISDKGDMKKGLSGKPALGVGKGLLFNFGKSQPVTMNMKDMNYPLDLIFINEELEVVAVRTLPPGGFETSVKACRLVLEVNEGAGSGLVGEKVELDSAFAKVLGFPCEEESEDEEEEEGAEKHANMDTGSVNIVVRVTTIPETAERLFKMGGSFRRYEDEVKALPNAMQVLDDKGKVLMNIVGGERIFSIEHTEQLIALSKKVEAGEASEEELGKLMKSIIEKQNNQKPEYV